MQGTIYAALAALAALAATTQSDETVLLAHMDDTSELCAIHTEQSAGGLRLTALAAEGLEGEYVFSLRQEGPGGSANIMQSGEIEPSYEGPSILSEVAVDPGGSYSASLQTYTYDGVFTCRAFS